jgi:hypothetical protein
LSSLIAQKIRSTAAFLAFNLPSLVEVVDPAHSSRKNKDSYISFQQEEQGFIHTAKWSVFLHVVL